MDRLTIRRPDDWHLHLRDGGFLSETVAQTARCFQRAIVMPNLSPPVSTGPMAMAYRDRILAARPASSSFEPLMTLYLTPQTTEQDIREARSLGVTAVKLYPAGATTNSQAGIHSLDNIRGTLEAMAELGMPLLVHGEVTHQDVDIFDREKVFIETQLIPLVEQNPQLKVVLEHITTAEAAQFVLSGPDTVAATITPQHLLFNRNHLLAGGLRPHNYCLPILKRQRHQEALRAAVAEKTSKIFLGSDSAPHERGQKESACGCAGCYSAPAALELYAQVFDELEILDHLEAFASESGPKFYGLPLNDAKISLVRKTWTIPREHQLPDGLGSITPFMAGSEVHWQLDEA